MHTCTMGTGIASFEEIIFFYDYLPFARLGNFIPTNENIYSYHNFYFLETNVLLSLKKSFSLEKIIFSEYK